ncbi:MAG: hypothetical protein JSR45_16525 [Proteobacteria bacterium]|nr:hypothetical protein [Pseudomonadota bacterium]
MRRPWGLLAFTLVALAASVALNLWRLQSGLTFFQANHGIGGHGPEALRFTVVWLVLLAYLTLYVVYLGRDGPWTRAVKWLGWVALLVVVTEAGGVLIGGLAPNFPIVFARSAIEQIQTRRGMAEAAVIGAVFIICLAIDALFRTSINPHAEAPIPKLKLDGL